jgi:hypothetical protein
VKRNERNGRRILDGERDGERETGRETGRRETQRDVEKERRREDEEEKRKTENAETTSHDLGSGHSVKLNL